MTTTGADATEAGADVQLVVEYFDLCNAALEAHRDVFPFKSLLALYDRVFANHDVQVDVYESNPSRAGARAVIRRTTGAITTIPESWAHTALRLKLRRGELASTVTRRAEFIRHPEQLDWSWLTNCAISGGPRPGFGPTGSLS